MKNTYLCSMNKLVIVGCGRLAEIITNAVVKGMLPDYELVGVYSRTASKAERIANKNEATRKNSVQPVTL